MHPLLSRQLKARNIDAHDDLDLCSLLDDISDAYYRNDRSQTLFERALDLTSEEFLAKAADRDREIHALAGSDEQVEQLLAMLSTTIEISTDALLLMDAQGEPILFSSRLPEYLDADDEFLASLNNDELVLHIKSSVMDSDEFIQQFESIRQDANLSSCTVLTLKNGTTLECQSMPYQQEQDQMGRVWNFKRLG